MTRDDDRTLADDLFAMDRAPDPHRWSVRARVFWIIMAAAALVLLIVVAPALAGLMSAAAAPRMVPTVPARHAREVSYPVWSFVVDLVAVLLLPVWWVADTVGVVVRWCRKHLPRVAAWWAEDHPALTAAAYIVGVIALVLLTAVQR